MTGTEFEAAFSAAPDYNPDLPAAMAAPQQADALSDVTVADEDIAPTPVAALADVALPDPGAEITPPEDAPVQADIADIGDQPAAPAALEGDRLIAAADLPSFEAPEALSAAPPPPPPEVKASAPPPRYTWSTKA